MNQLIGSFWKYASNMNGIADLETVFIDWASKEDLTLSQAKTAWEKVNQDVFMAFGVKQAEAPVTNNYYGPVTVNPSDSLQNEPPTVEEALQDSSIPEINHGEDKVDFEKDVPAMAPPIVPPSLENASNAPKPDEFAPEKAPVTDLLR